MPWKREWPLINRIRKFWREKLIPFLIKWGPTILMVIGSIISIIVTILMFL
jgi:hypothetical protein